MIDLINLLRRGTGDGIEDLAVMSMAADEIERLREALRLGVEARKRQTTYFKDRSRENLIASKGAESAFDKAARAALGEGK